MPQRELIIVACLDPIHETVIQKIPRHLTVVPWFSVDEARVPDMSHELAVTVSSLPPLDLIGEDEDRFGPQNDVLVRRVGSRAILGELHKTLLYIIDNHGAHIRSPEYAGEGYNPHVSKQADGYIDHGERIVLKTMQLMMAVDLPEGRRRIVGQYAMKDSHENTA